jgi:hypothetical protein
MLPVNTCVLAANDPKRVDPVIKLTDDVTVCTTSVCAVNVPADVILSVVVRDPVTVKLPDIIALPV